MIGSLRNDDSGWLKNELIFDLRISRYSKVMYFLPRFQNISKLNMEHSVKLEMEVLKEIAVAVHAQQTTQSWVISRCCFADLHKEIYKDFFYPRAQLLFCLSNVLFRFVPVPALIFLNCLASRCSQDGSWNNKSIF